MISLDNSILFTALPVLEDELSTTPNQALWVINAYPLVLSGLLLGTGTLGDRIGHRRMFLLGLTIFGYSSLAAAYAPTPGLLIATRALLGMGAAVMMPATLALIRATFDDDRERSTAMGLWGSTGVVGAAAGPILGGWLLEHFWWGSVFLINVPLCALGIVATVLFAPPNHTDSASYWDIVSSLLSLVALSGLTLTIKEATNPDRSTVVLCIAAAASATAAVFFVRRQRTLSHPLLTFDLFRNRIFVGGVLAAGGAMIAVSGMELLTTQNLQVVNGFSPLEAGLTLASVTVCAFPPVHPGRDVPAPRGVFAAYRRRLLRGRYRHGRRGVGDPPRFLPRAHRGPNDPGRRCRLRDVGVFHRDYRCRPAPPLWNGRRR